MQIETRSKPPTRKSVVNKVVEFDDDIRDITGYEKVDIMKLKNEAFDDNAMYAKKIKGTLLSLPNGSLPSLEQIKSSELFALWAPQKDKSENDDNDEKGPREEANIHDLWLPFLKPSAQNQSPGDWPKVYTPEALWTHFPMGVTAWKPCMPLPSLIIVV